jgi:hypothetical protein
MHSTTLTNDIIQPVLALINSSTHTTSEGKTSSIDNSQGITILITSPILRKYFQSHELHVAESVFLESCIDLEIEDEYKTYLLDFLSNILMGFTDKFVIGRKTKNLLSRSLSSFLAQANIQKYHSLRLHNDLSKLEWNNYLLIIDFTRFLIGKRIDCKSPFESGELSKLISCFKIFVLNKVTDRMSTLD